MCVHSMCVYIRRLSLASVIPVPSMSVQTGMSACGERLAGQDWAKGVCQSCEVLNERGHAGSGGLSLLAAVHERG